jgi:hypothetical protein
MPPSFDKRSMCTGKHRHKSEGAAAAHIRSLVAQNDVDPIQFCAYWCRHCKHWHVGHATRERIQKRKKFGGA